MEWAVTALFIQRLNSLRGEAEKCQRGEDDYERYRSPFLPRKENTLPTPPPPGPLPHHSLRPAPIDAGRRGGRKEGGIDALSNSFILLSCSCWLLVFFCWQCICFTAIQIMLSKGPSQTWDVTSTGNGEHTHTKKNNQQGWKNWAWAL